MKTLILGTLLILVVVFFGCDNNPIEPVKVASQTDTGIQGVSYPTIQVQTTGGMNTYKYEKISYTGEFLEIQLADCIGGGCGISIELSSIIYYETFK